MPVFRSRIDLRQMLRDGSTDEEIADAIADAIQRKPKEHHFGEVQAESSVDAPASGKRIQEKCPRSEDKLGLHILSKRIILRLVKIRRYSKMAQITKDTMIGELLRDQEHIDSIAEVLFGIGMHCLGCPSSQMETIEQAAMVHGIEPQELVDRLNDVVA